MNVRRALLAPILIVCALAANARAETYDLERCIDLALATSTNVGISSQQLETARSGVIRGYAQFMPNLSMRASAGHNWAGPTTGVFFDENGRPIQPAGFDYETYGFGISSGMRLFDWGSNFNSLSQAKRSADAAAYELEYTRDVIKALVIREYYDLVRQRKLMEVQEADLDAKRRNLEQVEAFYKIGSRTKADFLQARVDEANSQLDLLNVK
jgi:outer membrane protein TolC